MEFGILSAERSGSFHEEEVVGRGASEKIGRLGGVGGQFKGTVGLQLPSCARPFPPGWAFGVWKQNDPEGWRALPPVPGDSTPSAPSLTAAAAWAATRSGRLFLRVASRWSCRLCAPPALGDGLATGELAFRPRELPLSFLLEDFPVTIVRLFLVLILSLLICSTEEETRRVVVVIINERLKKHAISPQTRDV